MMTQIMALLLEQGLKTTKNTTVMYFVKMINAAKEVAIVNLYIAITNSTTRATCGRFIFCIIITIFVYIVTAGSANMELRPAQELTIPLILARVVWVALLIALKKEKKQQKVANFQPEQLQVS